jgi:putative ABC transport system substrate-binding protein
VNRRVFVTGLAAVLAAPLAVDAQQSGQVPRVGVLSPGYPPPNDPFDQRAIFEAGLRDLGWKPAVTINIEYRYAAGDAARLMTDAQDLVKLPVDVLVARSAPAIRAARRATSSIPIVMSASLDPIQEGFVASLSRPGGTTTGWTLLAENLDGKQLELLGAAMPKLSTVGFLQNPRTRRYPPVAGVAQQLGVELREFAIASRSQIAPAFAAMKEARMGAMVIRPDTLILDARAKDIAIIAARYGVPAISAFREFPEFGGLMSYGADLRDIHRRSASFVDKILKGAKPADIPLEQPTKFELVINLKTALGLTIPPPLLLRADQVIE